LKTCIIGDIHGCYSSLAALLEKIEGRADSFVFVGDYVDRGPDSRKVIELLLRLKTRLPQPVFLKGNHEFMFLQVIRGQDPFIFLNAGGRQTLESYGIQADNPEELAGRLPGEHLAFLEHLGLLHEDPNGIYVHAGLEPGRPLAEQSEEWCLWVRERFIRSTYDFGKPVVFGHTVFPEPLIQANKIGIDTGAVYGGKLTALLLPEKEFIQVEGEQHHPWPRTL